MRKGLMIVIMVIAIVGLFIYFQNSGTVQAKQPTPQKTTTPTQPPAPAQPTLEDQVKKLQSEVKDLQQFTVENRNYTTTVSEHAAKALERVRAEITGAIDTNADDIAELYDVTETNADYNAANSLAIVTTSEAVKVNATAIAAHSKTLRDHESRITNAQRSANRALGVALMMATEMTPEEAQRRVNKFVVGDLNLERLAVIAQKIPQGIKKAQTAADTANTTARTGLELLRKHGSKGWIFTHDKKLAKAAEEALAK